MIEAILFDFDGVIRQWDESDLGTFEAEADIETGTVFATAFSKELHEPLIRGEINWDQWRNETENRLVHSHGEFIRPIVKRFFRVRRTGRRGHDRPSHTLAKQPPHRNFDQQSRSIRRLSAARRHKRNVRCGHKHPPNRSG